MTKARSCPRQTGQIINHAPLSSVERSYGEIWRYAPRSNLSGVVETTEHPEITLGSRCWAAAIDRKIGSGIAIARETLTAVRDVIQGVQVSAPFGNVKYALEVFEALDEFADA